MRNPSEAWKTQILGYFFPTTFGLSAWVTEDRNWKVYDENSGFLGVVIASGVSKSLDAAKVAAEDAMTETLMVVEDAN